ncbi:hypothetical protein AAFF_G00274400 [Aldrovandia affinis]|uniref:Uncharacterized protein n=1 Tax=Aldrovandia affinis TaxID=143900 RepID=A0AAD7SSZ2_9TELE|nr:hypothetical protein AAFF_G00274400 [Aldrovandia affinis]
MFKIKRSVRRGTDVCGIRGNPASFDLPCERAGVRLVPESVRGSFACARHPFIGRADGRRAAAFPTSHRKAEGSGRTPTPARPPDGPRSAPSVEPRRPASRAGRGPTSRTAQRPWHLSTFRRINIQPGVQ